MKKLLQSVEKKIADITAADDVEIEKYLAGCACQNGKRVRAKLLLLSHAVSGNNARAPVEVAAVIEVVHLASLLHDDVVDEAQIRRGAKTPRARWGSKASIMLADYLLSRAMRLLCAKQHLPALDILIKTIETMSRGQIKEIANQNNADIAIEDYMEIIKRKTASLFSASCKIGALMAELPQKQAGALEKLGQNLGMVFQIRDDALDFWGDPEVTGKPVFNDLRGKNFTLPVILLRDEAEPADKNKLLSILKSEDCSAEKSGEILSMMNKYKIREKVFAQAARYFKKADDALGGIKDSPAKDGLGEILARAQERDM